MTSILQLAAGDGSSPVAVQLMPAITTIVVFSIAFFVLATKVWPKITAGLDDRERKIRDEIENAEKARHDAQQAKQDYETSLAEARKEAAEMIAQAKADAKLAADELRARNDAQLTEMKLRATRDIEAAKTAAIGELRAEAANLATIIAGKILQREISVDDQQRLVDESLQQLSAAQRN